MSFEKEFKKQQKANTSAVGDEGESAEPTPLDVVKQDGKIIHCDIKRS